MLLEIVERKIGDIVVVELLGKLAMGRESQRIETLVERLAQEACRKVIFDMTGIEYIDSAGIGLLALAAGKLKEAGGRFAVVAPEGRVRQFLTMTQMTAIVTVVKSVDEAIASMDGAQPASA